MDAGTTPVRARSLVMELGARTAIVDGKRVELPPTEFSLLAVLAARPGEVVSHKALLEEAFGDSAYMDTEDLHWRIWNIRKLIGDRDRKLIRNRRGVGFVLEGTAVEVVVGALPPGEAEATEVIDLTDGGLPDPPPPAGVAERPNGPPESRGQDRLTAGQAPRLVLRPATIVAAVLVAGVALGASWLAGYALSQRQGSPPVDSPESGPPDRGDDSATKERDGKRKRTPRRANKQRQKKGEGSAGGANPTFATAATGDPSRTSRVPGSGGVASQNASAGSGSSSTTAGRAADKEAPPPPPQPDAQLYHLYNAESGDHIMTTSSAVANQKQAAGYSSTVEGGVFTSQEKGTTAISLDSGSAYIYRNASAAPDGVNVAVLYRLSSSDDFFYTTSSSQANQAQAQGWSRTTVGYVAT